MTPTKEDVLKKNYELVFGTQKYENKVNKEMDELWVKPAMQEWASLQTPSNENYWRERCEAAEKVIEFRELPHEEFYRRNEFPNQVYRKWQELKSTPIPILTPCVELEKEVERLKGLIENLFIELWKIDTAPQD